MKLQHPAVPGVASEFQFCGSKNRKIKIQRPTASLSLAGGSLNFFLRGSGFQLAGNLTAPLWLKGGGAKRRGNAATTPMALLRLNFNFAVRRTGKLKFSGSVQHRYGGAASETSICGALQHPAVPGVASEFQFCGLKNRKIKIQQPTASLSLAGGSLNFSLGGSGFQLAGNFSYADSR